MTVPAFGHCGSPSGRSRQSCWTSVFARIASSWNHTYANNMGDSDYYVGACADCNITIDDAHAQNPLRVGIDEHFRQSFGATKCDCTAAGSPGASGERATASV